MWETLAYKHCMFFEKQLIHNRVAVQCVGGTRYKHRAESFEVLQKKTFTIKENVAELLSLVTQGQQRLEKTWSSLWAKKAELIVIKNRKELSTRFLIDMNK